MEISAIAIDLAKTVFQLHCVDGRGKVVLTKQLSRQKLLPFLANLPRCTVGMEACGGSNYWARQIAKHHEVRLIPAQFVKPYVKSNKNDAADAEAICEAMSRPSMRFVTPKTTDQQDSQCIHRVRSRLVAARTALINQIRGMLGEYGVVVSKSPARLKKELPAILAAAEQHDLSGSFQATLQDLQSELRELDEKIERYEGRIKQILKSDEVAQRLTKVPGIGPITATALHASSSPSVFKNGRQFAASLGLVPKQHSSGGKNVLLSISKRGDPYLRTLLIHGARSALYALGDKRDRRSEWLRKVIERRGVNRAAVALANKNARVAWVLMTTKKRYEAA